jgi:hypothetical protein
VIALLALASGVTRSTGFTVYTTVGLADMPAELMRDANTLAATSMQLAAGLAIAASTVGLRIGGALTGSGGAVAVGGVAGGPGQGAFTVAFCLLALVAVGCAAEALRMDRRAGDAARQPRAAAPATR